MSEEQFNRIRQELEACPQLKLVMPSDLLALPEDLALVLRRAFRAGRITLVELAQGLRLDSAQAEAIAERLVQKGYLRRAEGDAPAVYFARFGGKVEQSKRGLLEKLF